jgi:7,8-dihydropterin-6-yl-methyl-4-(beta-D-ribofuranosyl)aminobenzene 5'-phosphate synthase
MPAEPPLRLPRRPVLAALLLLGALPASAAEGRGPVRAVKVTVLSTMLADAGTGEWGFAALVEADGHRILFDTGARPDTVLQNARELGIDLADVQDVVLSHFHGDHTGGLLTLREALAPRNPKALSRAHVGRGFFWSRTGAKGEVNTMIALRPRYEAAGGRFLESAERRELHPGIWLSGRVPRVHPERNYGPPLKVQTPDGIVDDDLPEDLSLYVDTEDGLVVITGCGHAGIVNTLEHARQAVRQAPVRAVVGGFHLFALDDERLDWTADRMKAFEVANVIGAHCTGIEAVYRIRQRAGLDRKACVVGSVGSSFTLHEGIDPRALAR